MEEKGGRRWADFEVGGRDARTFLRLYGQLPAEPHLAGKGGAVNWNEGLHSFRRGKLNRLGRRPKGYS